MKSIADFSERFSELVVGKTFSQVGAEIGLSKQTVSAYVHGIRNAKKPTIMAISNQYKINPLWLMGYDVDKYNSAQTQVDAMEDFEDDLNMLMRIERIKRASESDLKVIDLILEKYAQPGDDGVETDTREVVIDIVEAGKNTLPVAARGGITSASTDALNKLSKAAKKTDKVF